MKTLIYGVLFLMMLALIILAPAGCGMMVKEDVAIRALETQGFSNVKIIEKDVFFVGCKGGDGNDVVRFTAIATNPAGEEVQVCVFAGWPFKAATIRTK